MTCSSSPRGSSPVASLDGLRAKALVALWEALPATASHQGAFDFPDASRSLFEAVAGMTGLLPLVSELEAWLETDGNLSTPTHSITGAGWPRE
jgi:hypothetical protein